MRGQTYQMASSPPLAVVPRYSMTRTNVVFSFHENAGNVTTSSLNGGKLMGGTWAASSFFTAGGNVLTLLRVF